MVRVWLLHYNYWSRLSKYPIIIISPINNGRLLLCRLFLFFFLSFICILSQIYFSVSSIHYKIFCSDLHTYICTYLSTHCKCISSECAYCTTIPTLQNTHINLGIAYIYIHICTLMYICLRFHTKLLYAYV